MSLDRFKSAQASPHSGFAAARDELQSGEKTSHWIWYIFPQLAGLGGSSMSRTYAIADLREAMDYLQDPLLGSRLAELTQIVVAQLAQGVPLRRLMGGTIDAQKIVSSLTLFEIAARELGPQAKLEFVEQCRTVLTAAEKEGFPRCRFTLEHAGPS
jgi:uncharacterized protein (DUF1810 family)